MNATITDMFCGAGGSSDGARRAGAEVVLGLNHWRTACESWASNHSAAQVDCAEISATDPRRYPSTTVLLASPECTNHSLAKRGQVTKTDELTLWDEAERSRATMWDVPRFAERHNYEICVIENVVEAVGWVMFPAWLSAMEALGYDHRILSLNSMCFPPTPQSRDRIYIVFWKRGKRVPDLDFHPESWCEACERQVGGVQVFKKPATRVGRYGLQYLYHCPECAAVVTPLSWPAASAIDWSIPTPAIKDRARALKATTLARIQRGIDKHGFWPAVVPVSYIQDKTRLPRTIAEALVTQTGRSELGLCWPSGICVQVGGNAFERGDYVRARSTGAPQMTVTATADRALVTPAAISVDLRGTNAPRPVSSALSTLCASGNHHGLLVPPGVVVGHYNPGVFKRAADPLNTVTAVDHHSLVVPPGMVVSYYRNGRAEPASSPFGTVTPIDRHALLTHADGAVPELMDCGFRMLEPEDHKRAMAFEDDYVILGNRRQRTRQAGNAVTPPVIAAITERVLASLDGKARPASGRLSRKTTASPTAIAA